MIRITSLVTNRLRQKGYIVTVCHDTEGAERYLETERPDLIVLDILLPGENGFEFCRRIRKRENLDQIPIILVSIKSELEDKLAGFATGADDYIAKPFLRKNYRRVSIRSSRE
jgi:two-component system phosphate regulon response regulator PhoB